MSQTLPSENPRHAHRPILKTVIAVAVLLAVIALMATVVLYRESIDRQAALELLETRLSAQLGLRSKALVLELEQLRRDAKFLAAVPPVSGLIRARLNGGFDALEQTPDALWQHRLEIIFKAFAAANVNLTQVRLIGVADDGRELVRIDQVGSTVSAVPPDRLQAKGDRDYFIATLKLMPGETHTSDLNLNREYGKVQEPQVPTLRVTTPLFAPGGALFGLIALNLDARPVLATLHADLPSAFQVYLTNSAGEYLLHPDATRTFGFEFGRRHRLPDDWSMLPQATIDPERMQSYQTATGIVHAKTLRVPLDARDPSRFLAVTLASSDAFVTAITGTARRTLLWGISSGALVVGALAYIYWLVLSHRRQLLIEQARLAERDLTQLRAAEASLRDSQERLTIATQANGIGIWEWDAIAGELTLDATLYALYGRHQDDSRSALEVWRSSLHPDDLAPFEQTFRDAVAAAQPLDGSFRIITAAGEVRHIRSKATSFVDATGRVTRMLGTNFDCTAEKQRERQLDELNTTLEQQVAARTVELHSLSALQHAILANASYAVIATDLRGTVMLFNPAAERLLGYASAEVVGRSTPAIFHDPAEVAARAKVLNRELGTNLEPGFEVFVAKAKQGTADTTEWTYLHKDGQRIPVQLSVSALRRDDGPILGYLGMVLDLSELERARLELETLNDSLQARTLEAEGATLAKGQFLANMSHEIRSPMNAILGMQQLLLGTELSVRQRDYADKAHSATRSLLHLLNDILDFSKIEAGKIEIEHTPFSIDKLLRDLSVILSASTGAKPVEVLFSIDPRLPSQLCGDAFRLRQVLLNLAGNAIKFTETGEVVVAIGVLRSDSLQTEVEITVSDTGIGIARDKLRLIFEGFSQAEASTTRRYGGTGLGLAISQHLVSLLGGTLRAESELGRGSRFHFKLVFDNAADSDTGILKTRFAPRRPDKSTRVLIVDDNQSAREVMLGMVESMGMSCDVAASGSEGIEKLRSQAAAAPYDFVFMDWQMPDLDGLAAAQAMRALQTGGNVPIIIMVTAYGREVVAEQCTARTSPVDAVIVKPVTASMLHDAMLDTSAGAPVSIAHVRSKDGRKYLTGLRLLVVDDNTVNLQVARELLSNQGAAVTTAEGGAEGVADALSAQPPFDAVLMDIQMPGVDGYEATRRIREHTRTLPIIAMTANAMAADQAACLAAGMNDHIAKPIDIDVVVATILSHCCEPSVASVHVTSALPVVSESWDVNEIELEVALARLDKNKSLYAVIARGFLKDARVMAAELGRHLHEDAHAIAARQLHTLKGLAGTVGMQAVADFAARLEFKLKDPTRVMDVDADVRALETLLASGCERLTSILADPEFSPPAYEPAQNCLGELAFAVKLAELELLLTGANMRAISAFRELQAQCGADLAERIRPLAAAVDDLNFRLALQHCRAVRAALT